MQIYVAPSKARMGEYDIVGGVLRQYCHGHLFQPVSGIYYPFSIVLKDKLPELYQSNTK